MKNCLYVVHLDVIIVVSLKNPTSKYLDVTVTGFRLLQYGFGHIRYTQSRISRCFYSSQRTANPRCNRCFWHAHHSRMVPSAGLPVSLFSRCPGIATLFLTLLRLRALVLLAVSPSKNTALAAHAPEAAAQNTSDLTVCGYADDSENSEVGTNKNSAAQGVYRAFEVKKRRLNSSMWDYFIFNKKG